MTYRLDAYISISRCLNIIILFSDCLRSFSLFGVLECGLFDASSLFDFINSGFLYINYCVYLLMNDFGLKSSRFRLACLGDNGYLF